MEELVCNIVCAFAHKIIDGIGFVLQLLPGVDFKNEKQKESVT